MFYHYIEEWILYLVSIFKLEVNNSKYDTNGKYN